MDVKIVWGPPASGKSTFVENNRGKNSITFDFDKIMTVISGLPPHRKNENLIGYVLDFRETVINRLANENKLDEAWIIVTRLDDKFKKKFEGFSPEYLLMDTTKKECLERVESDPDRSEVSDEMKKVINEWFDEFSPDERGGKMPKEIEHRRLSVELRAEEGETPKIVGHAAVFDKPADIYGFEEVVRSGAFTESIKKDDVIQIMCWVEQNQALFG